MEVRVTDARSTHRLRREILRPHQSIEEMDWPGDGDPEAIHLVALEDGEPVGVVSFFPMERAGSSAAKPFRLRGMGVVSGRRGSGIGRALLERGSELVAAAGGDEIWCQARIGAVEFYEGVGFTTVGDYWDVPIIGPHIVMWRSLP